MSDNLRITMPVNTSDQAGKVAAHKDPSTVDAINPQRVTPRDTTGQTQSEGQTLKFALDNRSVFQKFVEQLQQTPALEQTLEKLVFGAQQSLKAGEAVSPIQQSLQEILTASEMTPEQMLDALRFQQQNSTRFSAPLFQVLREMLQSSNGARPQLQDVMGRFLKAYDSYEGAALTTKTVFTQLQELMGYIPKPYRTAIEEQMTLLKPMPEASDKEHSASSGQFTAAGDKGQEASADGTEAVLRQNLAVLKEKILPLIGKYVASSNDFGTSRDHITLLLHDISRLNVGSREEVSSRFQDLMNYCQYELNLPGEVLRQMKILFVKTMATPPHTENTLVDKIMNLLTGNGKAQQGGAQQAMVRDTLKSLLLDQSVYMPYTHLYLPVQYQGASLFAQVWVEKGGGGKASGSAGHPLNLVLSFDIQNLGQFQMALTEEDGRVSCRMNLPDGFHQQEEDVSEQIRDIFLRNGLHPQDVTVTKEPIEALAHVMHKVYERRSAIDVTV